MNVQYSTYRAHEHWILKTSWKLLHNFSKLLQNFYHSFIFWIFHFSYFHIKYQILYEFSKNVKTQQRAQEQCFNNVIFAPTYALYVCLYEYLLDWKFESQKANHAKLIGFSGEPVSTAKLCGTSNYSRIMLCAPLYPSAVALSHPETGLWYCGRIWMFFSCLIFWYSKCVFVEWKKIVWKKFA